MPKRIAVDAMGGDQAPSVVVEGAVEAAQRAEGDLVLLLFGPEAQVEQALEEHGGAAGELPIQVVDAPEVIGMGEAPAAAVKRKQRSSIHLGLGACKKGQADAFASAGNTGAVMAASLFILGRLPEVDRPAVIGIIPTLEGRSLLLDVGTNVDCRPAHLAQFARMGSVYVERVWERKNPTTALLNVGEEPGKGNEQVKAAYKLLDQMPDLHFVGNVEGRDLFIHAADVVVCDGFVGNIILKFGESMATTMLSKMVQRELKRQGVSPKEKSVVQSVLRGVQKPFDYEARGGVPLLGVGGNVLIGHGSSSARAIERMILAAGKVAEENVAASIAAAFEDAPEDASAPAR